MVEYPSVEYSDEEEYNDNVLDEQRDQWDESYGNYPASKKSESLYSLFNKVWKTNDSSKVANLTKFEIGDLGLSVRECQNISWFSNYLGHKGVSTYFSKMGEITLATSMSRNGWFVELFVTSKKFAQKSSKLSGTNQPTKGKWSLFGRKTTAVPEVAT